MRQEVDVAANILDLMYMYVMYVCVCIALFVVASQTLMSAASATGAASTAA